MSVNNRGAEVDREIDVHKAPFSVLRRRITAAAAHIKKCRRIRGEECRRSMTQAPNRS